MRMLLVTYKIACDAVIVTSVTKELSNTYVLANALNTEGMV